MKHPTNSARTAALAVIAVSALAAIPAHAAVPGISGSTSTTAPGVSFSLEASEGFSTQPDGASIYSWGYGCKDAPGGYLPTTMQGSCGPMQIPGPTLIVHEGDLVSVTLTNQLPAAAGNTSIIFPGFDVCAGTLDPTKTPACTPNGGVAGVLTQEAAPQGSVTYQFVAKTPGTRAYYSGTQGDLQVEMGLYGAVIVLPTNTTILTGCSGGVHPGETDFRLASAAYDHPQSCYNREYLFQLAEMQSSIHAAALAQKQACDAAIANGAAQTPPVVVPCPVISVQTEPYHPNYFLVNGRSMPDDMDAPFAPMYPNQPYNGNPHMHPNELVLVREIGQGRIQHPLHIHGNHARVLGRDGNLLVSATDATKLAGPLIFTFPTVSGQAVDAIFSWTGKGLNWDVYGHNAANDPGCTPDGNGFNTGGTLGTAAPNYGEYCPDHLKPIPITPPDPQIVANGLWYGGTPYLGLSESKAAGFPSTPLPPGTAKQNKPGGYAFMWHSHDEREITTNDVFPGGMMMMLVIDPPDATIDEAK